MEQTAEVFTDGVQKIGRVLGVLYSDYTRRQQNMYRFIALLLMVIGILGTALYYEHSARIQVIRIDESYVLGVDAEGRPMIKVLPGRAELEALKREWIARAHGK